MSELEMQSETTRAANAIDIWDLPKESVEARRLAKIFYSVGDNRKFWFWMYYSKIMARLRAERHLL